MVFHSRYRYFYRSGPQDRRQVRRFFYIKNTGWFVYLRGDQEVFEGIEVNSGIAGPFANHSQARGYLERIIQQAHHPFGEAHKHAV